MITSLLVVLVSILLALVVDKLSEARSAKVYQMKEIEKQEKERELRHEQLNALRCPKVHVRRRTIRRLIHFQSHNPAERAQALKQGKNTNFWRQNSLPQIIKQTFTFPNIKMHRMSSAPLQSESSYGTMLRLSEKELGLIEEEDVGTLADAATTGSEPVRSGHRPFGRGAADRHFSFGEIVQTSTKKRNPLSLMRNPSSFIDEQMLKISRRKLDDTAADTGSASLAEKMETSKTDMKKSTKKKKFVEEESLALASPHTHLPVQRHISSTFDDKLVTIDPEGLGVAERIASKEGSIVS